MLFAVSRYAVLAGLFGARHTEYVSMRAQHELLHVGARHLWLTRQENRGKRSQNHDAKLTRPFLRVGRGWLARLVGLCTYQCIPPPTPLRANVGNRWGFANI